MYIYKYIYIYIYIYITGLLKVVSGRDILSTNGGSEPREGVHGHPAVGNGRVGRAERRP